MPDGVACRGCVVGRSYVYCLKAFLPHLKQFVDNIFADKLGTAFKLVEYDISGNIQVCAVLRVLSLVTATNHPDLLELHRDWKAGSLRM